MITDAHINWQGSLLSEAKIWAVDKHQQNSSTSWYFLKEKEDILIFFSHPFQPWGTPVKYRCYTGDTWDSGTQRAFPGRWDGLAATENLKEHFPRHMKIGKQDFFLCSGLPHHFLHPINKIILILKPNSVSIKLHVIMKHLINFWGVRASSDRLT